MKVCSQCGGGVTAIRAYQCRAWMPETEPDMYYCAECETERTPDEVEDF